MLLDLIFNLTVKNGVKNLTNIKKGCSTNVLFLKGVFLVLEVGAMVKMYRVLLFSSSFSHPLSFFFVGLRRPEIG